MPIWPPKLFWPAYKKQREVPPPESILIMKAFAEALVVWAMPETVKQAADKSKPRRLRSPYYAEFNPIEYVTKWA